MPSEPQPQHGNLNDRGREIIHTALEKICEHADLNDAQRRAVTAGLIEAFTEGARLAAAEVSAQVIEAGANVQLDLRITGTDLTPDDIEP